MKNKTQKLVRYLFLTVFLFAFATISLNMGTAKAKAATAYKKLFTDSEEFAESAKSGKYYFKWKETENLHGPVYISKKKNSGYKKTPIQRFYSYSNGKRAYYIRDNVLYYYTFSSQKEHKAQQLPTQEYFRFSIVYGNRLFMTAESDINDIFKCRTYSYNVKTKKFKLVKDNCELYSRKGKYALGTTQYTSDVSPRPLVLYKITSSGVTKIKKLTSRALGGTIMNGRVYYFEYSGLLMRKGTIYHCNLDGSDRKKIATITTPEKDECVYVSGYTRKKCTVSTINHEYEYTYSTKKLKKIR